MSNQEPTPHTVRVAQVIADTLADLRAAAAAAARKPGAIVAVSPAALLVALDHIVFLERNIAAEAPIQSRAPAPLQPAAPAKTPEPPVNNRRNSRTKIDKAARLPDGVVVSGAILKSKTMKTAKAGLCVYVRRNVMAALGWTDRHAVKVCEERTGDDWFIVLERCARGEGFAISRAGGRTFRDGTYRGAIKFQTDGLFAPVEQIVGLRRIKVNWSSYGATLRIRLPVKQP